MRDDDDTTLEFFDGSGQRVDGSHVQVVRRLIEQQDVRVLHGENGKDDSVSETVGQLADRVGLVGTGDTETTNLLSPILNVLLWKFGLVKLLQVLHWRLVEWQLVGRMLRVLGELELRVNRDGSLGWVEGTSDKVEQGGFTGTVVTDNSDTTC